MISDFVVSIIICLTTSSTTTIVFALMIVFFASNSKTTFDLMIDSKYDIDDVEFELKLIVNFSNFSNLNFV